VTFTGSNGERLLSRLTADYLKEFLDAARGERTVPATTTRARMVHGTNVGGYNLVPDWLKDARPRP
jgi:hypothetical protein